MLSNLKISPHDLIGCSFYGYHIEVLVEHNDVTGIFVSQKQGEYYIIKLALAQDAIPLIEHEERIIQNINHWGVVSFISRIDINGFPALVLHRYTRGVLAQYIGLLSIEEISNIFSRLCEVCDFLREHDIFHRDIKPDNIALDNGGVPVLIDFGMSCCTGKQEEYFTGTLDYAAPEVLKGEKVTYDSELYSIASVVYALIHGIPPSKDHALRTSHGLSVQEDAKLNRMLNLEPSSRREKKRQVNLQQSLKKEKVKQSTNLYIFMCIVLIFLLWFSITLLLPM